MAKQGEGDGALARSVRGMGAWRGWGMGPWRGWGIGAWRGWEDGALARFGGHGKWPATFQ
jgi:hypothetical protein